MLAIGSSLLVAPVAVLFLVLSTLPERHIGWILLGVHLLGSVADLQQAFPHHAVPFYGILVTGLLLILYGEKQLATTMINKQVLESATIPPTVREHFS
jgi:hypothetical protein